MLVDNQFSVIPLKFINKISHKNYTVHMLQFNFNKGDGYNTEKKTFKGFNIFLEEQQETNHGQMYLFYSNVKKKKQCNDVHFIWFIVKDELMKCLFYAEWKIWLCNCLYHSGVNSVQHTLVKKMYQKIRIYTSSFFLLVSLGGQSTLTDCKRNQN